jgi:hypothetical protein
MTLNPDFLWYLVYRAAAYALLNLGEDVALAAFMFS